MSSQVYLMLLRHPFPDSEAKLAMQIKTMLGSMIRGDSLDVPFMNCIKCHSFSHSIGGGGLSYSDRTGSAVDTMSWKDYGRGVAEMAAGGAVGGAGLTLSVPVASQVTGAATGLAAGALGGLGGAMVAAGRGIGKAVGARHTGPGAPAKSKWLYDDGAEPGLLEGKIPEHNTVAFSKNLDSATPQLSFGCSSQERFPIAIFFLRRKTSMKLAGVTNPHTVMAYRNCLITDWSTDGETEEVHLNYEEMGVASFLQIADTPIPQGISWRHWDKVNKSGGELGWSALLVPLTTLVVAAGGGVVAGVAAASGSGSNVTN